MADEKANGACRRGHGAARGRLHADARAGARATRAWWSTVGVAGLGGDRVVTVTAPRPPATGTVDRVGLAGQDRGRADRVRCRAADVHARRRHDAARHPPADRDVARSRQPALRHRVLQHRPAPEPAAGARDAQQLPRRAGPDTPVPDWEYSHDPLDVQLQSQGIRQFELDVWDEPERATRSSTSRRSTRARHVRCSRRACRRSRRGRTRTATTCRSRSRSSSRTCRTRRTSRRSTRPRWISSTPRSARCSRRAGCSRRTTSAASPRRCPTR